MRPNRYSLFLQFSVPIENACIRLRALGLRQYSTNVRTNKEYSNLGIS